MEGSYSIINHKQRRGTPKKAGELIDPSFGSARVKEEIRLCAVKLRALKTANIMPRRRQAQIKPTVLPFVGKIISRKSLKAAVSFFRFKSFQWIRSFYNASFSLVTRLTAPQLFC